MTHSSPVSADATKVLASFYKTVDVMKSARNSDNKLMSIWADDMKAVEDVVRFLETLRDGATPAQAAVAPVAWAILAENGNIRMWSTINADVTAFATQIGAVVTPLYAASPQAAPAGEEIAKLVESMTDELRDTISCEWGSHLCYRDEVTARRICDEDKHCRCIDIARAVVPNITKAIRDAASTVPQTVPNREDIAYIIEPRAFGTVEMHGRQNASEHAVRMFDYALSRADAIIALSRPLRGGDNG